MQTTHTERNIIFLSELWHIEALERFFDERKDIRDEGYLLIPLDAEIESVLAKKEIAFQSGKEYRTPDAARMILAEEWTSSIFESEPWSFFTYRGVSLGRLYAQSLQGYISRILYYTDIVSNVIARHQSIQRLIVFPAPSARPPIERCLTGAMIEALVDVITHIARESGKEILVPNESLPVQRRNGFALYTLKRTVFGWGIAILNSAVALMCRPKRIRILASDYWSNLMPSLRYLDSAEVILTDRKEAFNAGIGNIWKFRMRFLHLDAFSPKISDERKQSQASFIYKWHSIQNGSDLPALSFRGFSIQPLLVKALDRIVTEAVTRTLGDIDNAHAMITHLKPDVVMLRATISSQTHFAILAGVARVQNIPSIEMQHGLMYLGPGSTGKRHSAQFMGMYGPFVQKEMKEAGDKQSTPIIIGSPRFDVYKSLQKVKSTKDATEGRRITFLCIVPMVSFEETTDSYDVVEYFQAVASALRKIPNAHVILKLRQGHSRNSFFITAIPSLFDGVSYTVAQFEPLHDLFRQADVVISGYSTAVLEALQCGKPLVYVGLCPLENMTGLHHFPPYVKEGAMRFASSEKELSHILGELASNPNARKGLSEKSIAFLSREYAFDGKASERTAAFITSLVSKTQ